MRKLVLTVVALLFSMNVLAAALPHNIGAAVMNAVQTHSNKKMIKTSFPLVYGGQDMRPLFATANESVWAGQSTLTA